MSATDRARKAAEQHETRRTNAMLEGMRRALADPEGRALIHWMIENATSAEGKGSAMLRGFGRDILNAARHASWEGVQVMREEWEKPKQGTQAEAEDEGGEE